MGVPGSDVNCNPVNAVFLFRDFTGAEYYRHGLQNEGRYSNILDQSQARGGHEKANGATVQTTSKKAVFLKYSATAIPINS